jgi:hypothetical protein
MNIAQAGTVSKNGAKSGCRSFAVKGGADVWSAAFLQAENEQAENEIGDLLCANVFGLC